MENNVNNVAIGKIVDILIKINDLQEVDVATSINMHKLFLSQIRTGKMTMPEEKIEEFCVSLKIKKEDFMYFVDYYVALDKTYSDLEKYQNTMRYILEFFCPIRYKDASGVKIYTPISKTLQKAPAKNSNQN